MQDISFILYNKEVGCENDFVECLQGMHTPNNLVGCAKVRKEVLKLLSNKFWLVEAHLYLGWNSSFEIEEQNAIRQKRIFLGVKRRAV